MITVRIWFTKRSEAAYISLLDLQRVMGRSLKRSGLPVWYTLGFNPHIYMTFSCPLALGQESLVESVDVKTEEEVPDFEAWKQALDRVMPAGIAIKKVEPVRLKAGQIGFAEYLIRYPAAAAVALDGYNGLEHALVEKKSKRGMRTIDLKEYLPNLEYQEDGAGEISVRLRLPASETINLNPALLTGFLQQQFGLPAQAAGILRTGLFTRDGEAFS